MKRYTETQPPPRTPNTAKKQTLPFGWIVKQSSTFPDRVYYFNTNTGASTWEVPELVKFHLKKQNEQHSSQQPCARQEPSFSPCYESDRDDSPFSYGAGSDVDTRVSDPVFTTFQKNIYDNMKSQNPVDDPGGGHCAQDVDLRKGTRPHFSPFSFKITGRGSCDNSSRSSVSVEALAKFDKDERKKKKAPKSSLNFEKVYSVSNILSSLRQHSDKAKNKKTKNEVKSNKTEGRSKNESVAIKASTSNNVNNTNLSPVLQPSGANSTNFKKSNTLRKRKTCWSTRSENANLSKNISVKSQASHSQKSSEKRLSLDDCSKSRPSSSRSKKSISYEDLCADDVLPTTFGCDKNDSPKKVERTKQKDILSKKVEEVASDPTDLRHRLACRDLRHKLRKKHGTSNDSDSEPCKAPTSSDGRKPWSKKRKSLEFSDDLGLKKLKNSKLVSNRDQSVCESSENVSARSKIEDTVKKSKLSLSLSPKNREVELVKNYTKANIGRNTLIDRSSLIYLNKNNSGKTSLQRTVGGRITKSDVRKVIADTRNIKKVISVKPVAQEYLSSKHFERSEKQTAVLSWVDSVLDCGPAPLMPSDVNQNVCKNNSGITATASCSRNVETGETDRRIVVPTCAVPPFFVNDREYSTGNAMVDAVSYINENSKGDVCDMEVDEDDNQMITDLREFRQELRFHQSEAVGELTQTVSSCSEMVVDEPKSSRLTDKTLYIVIDTNVLIHDLKFVTELRDNKFKGFGLPYLLIPWVVMQELDYLKDAKLQSMSARSQQRAQQAVSFLFACLQSRHPRVLGQSSKKANEALEGLHIECNDDRVLQTVHQCMKENPHSCVVLLSGDKNLCNKAVVNGIEVFGKETLFKGISNLLLQYEPVSPPGETPDGYVMSPQRTSDNLASVSQHVPSPSALPSVPAEMKIVDEVLCAAKVIIKDVFGTILQTEMEEAFGNMWPQIVYKKPPWSAHDVMVCFQKHWMAVFGLLFDRRLQTYIDGIVTRLSPKEGLQMERLRELLQDVLVLLKEFEKKSSYKDAIPHAVNQIESLLHQFHKTDSGASRTTQPQTDRVPVPICDNRNREQYDTVAVLKSQEVSVKHFDARRSAGEHSYLPHTPEKNPVPGRRRVATTPVTVRGGESGARAPAVQLPHRPGPRKQQVVLPTVSTPPQVTPASPQCSEQQVPTPAKNHHDPIAEALVNVQNVFQTIWETIDHWCTAIQSAIKERSPESMKKSEITLEKLVPLVTDLRHKYHMCLSFPPLEIRSRHPQFDNLCVHLNMFFPSLNLPACHNTAITTDDLLVFFGTLDKRPTLQAGLAQLDAMIQTLYECVKMMPD